MPRVMTVGRLAEAAGVKTSTVRYYEAVGLLPRAPRTTAGYRVFSDEMIRRMRVIRAAQQFGFPLRTVAEFLQVRGAGGEPCERVRDAGADMLVSLDAEIAS